MSTDAGTEWYVYWKTREPQRVAAALRDAHATLARDCPGLQVRVLQREASADGRATQMAIYRRPGGVDPVTAAAIGAALDTALSGLLDAPRVVETFRPVEPGA